jgi:hypothetical protein
MLPLGRVRTSGQLALLVGIILVGAAGIWLILAGNRLAGRTLIGLAVIATPFFIVWLRSTSGPGPE